VLLSTSQLAYIGVAGAAAALALAILAAASVSRVTRRLDRALGAAGADESLEERLAQAHAALAAATERVSQLERRVSELEALTPHALSRVGLVRFNPFDGTGADLSFAVALLNDRSNGVILTSLWGRDEVRVYAKPVANGDSTHPLSPEERQALELARRQRRH
jgi:hypothetical protein